jgi:hypothetical protein
MYVVSVAATAVGVTALTVLGRFERKNDHLLRRKISLVLSEEALPLSAIVAALTLDGAVLSRVEYPATANERILEVLETQRGVGRVRVEPLP